MRAHMFARRNIGFDDPVFGQVTAPNRIVFGQVAGDIGKLECEAKVSRPVERFLVGGRHAHDNRHHPPDRTRDMIAILKKVGFHARSPVSRVERKSFDHVIGQVTRDAGFANDNAQRIESGFTRPLAVERHCRQFSDMCDPFGRIGDCRHRAAMILPVGNIVACPAPEIQQPCPFARGFVEEFTGEREGL